jgi:hypothetical protein
MPTPQTFQNMAVKLIMHFSSVCVSYSSQNTYYFLRGVGGDGATAPDSRVQWAENEYIKRKTYRAQQILNYCDK